MSRIKVVARCVCAAVIALMLASHAFAGRITFVIAELPADTPAEATITLGASVGAWNPSQPGYAFTKRSDGRYTLVLDVNDETLLEYKVTQGSWPTVETNADGSDVANRRLTVNGDETVTLVVARWSDGKPASRPSTITGSVETIADVASPQLGNTRNLIVYLPPSYGAGDGRHPVLYMHDGQNLFDAATSFAGEWGADEAAEALAERGLEVIIVGIPNNADRMNEYGPFPDPKFNAAGKGEAYAAFIVDTVKPLIDERYRTLPDRSNTGIAGSSMGGLISLYTALAYPDTFGFAGVFSPSLFIGDGQIFQWVKENPNPDLRIYLDMGTREGMVSLQDQAAARGFVNDTMRMANLLVEQGNEVMLHIDRGAAHNEAAWRERFPAALAWFLSGAEAADQTR